MVVHQEHQAAVERGRSVCAGVAGRWRVAGRWGCFISLTTLPFSPCGLAARCGFAPLPIIAQSGRSVRPAPPAVSCVLLVLLVLVLALLLLLLAITATITDNKMRSFSSPPSSLQYRLLSLSLSPPQCVRRLACPFPSVISTAKYRQAMLQLRCIAALSPLSCLQVPHESPDMGSQARVSSQARQSLDMAPKVQTVLACHWYLCSAGSSSLVRLAIVLGESHTRGQALPIYMNPTVACLMFDMPAPESHLPCK